MPITHAKVSTKSDGADSSRVQPSDWNHAHIVTALAVNMADGATPDRKLEVNTGAAQDGLRISYNDDNGSAAVYTEILVASTGSMTFKTQRTGNWYDNANGSMYFQPFSGLTYFNAPNANNKFTAYDYEHSSGGSVYLILQANGVYFFNGSGFCGMGHTWNASTLKLNSYENLFEFANGKADTDTQITFAGTTNSGLLKWMEDEDRFQFADIVMVGDGTNYAQIDAAGNLTFGGSAGLYPRRLSQADAPAAGTGATQLDTGELCLWHDTDDSKCYLCFNDGGTVKKVELT